MTESSIVVEPKTPRRWWIAAPLALVCQPAAYLYVGRPARALAIASIYLALGFILWHGLFGRLVQPAGIATFLATLVALLLFVLVDCIRIARASGDYRLRGFNRWWIYLGGLIAVYGAAGTAFDPAYGGLRRAARAISIPSGSMAPTLRIGDLAFADARAYDHAEPRRGDVVIFDNAADQSLYVKRVVGVPGDDVQMRAGKLYLNGDIVPTEPAAPIIIDPPGRTVPILRENLPDGASHVIAEAEAQSPGAETGVFKVPPDNLFVLGDNRGNSSDSRFPSIGYVRRDQLRGRVLWIYWSADPGRIGGRVE